MIHYTMEWNLRFYATFVTSLLKIRCLRSQESRSIEVYLSQEETDVAYHYISKSNWYTTILSG
jgi:hypothetical protein